MGDAYEASLWAWGAPSLAWGMRPCIWLPLALRHSGEASCHFSTSLPEHEELSRSVRTGGGGQLGGWVGSTGGPCGPQPCLGP